MEELIDKIENAAYYFPAELFSKPNELDAYRRGMIAGRNQALEILRAE